MTPLVSLIVAVYNAEECLARCLDSLVKQSYKNIEILCVNDASTDNSQKILEEYIKRDKRIRIIIHEKNKNAGGAYNTGIENAKGEYICIVDNDDWLSENAIETLVFESENGKYDVVGPARASVFGGVIKNISNTFIKSIDKEKIIKKSLIDGFAIIGDLIRKDLFVNNDLKYPQDVFYEDIAIGYCILFMAKSIKGIDDCLYFYSHLPSSVTGKATKGKIIDRMNMTELFIDNLRKRGYYDKNYKSVIDYKYLMYSAYTLVMLSKIDYFESVPLAKTLKKRIKCYLPNKYLCLSTKRNRFIIIYPLISLILGNIYCKFSKVRK